MKQYQEMYSSVEYIQDMLEIAEAENEKELIEETIKELERAQERFRQFELLFLFSEHDHNNAIVSLHAGAGGTEAKLGGNVVADVYPLGGEFRLPGPNYGFLGRG